MANVRVRYEGTASIIVQDKAWYQDEVHEIDEKLAQALVAFGEKIVVLPVPGAADDAGETGAADDAGETGAADDAGETGTAVDEASADDASEVVVEEAVEEAAPKAKRKR